jgi:HK97 family phage portal protein
MPIVRSAGVLTAITDPVAPWSPTSASGVGLYGYAAAYATIYATQPNVRTCVDFIARNIAELDLHVFRRVSDTDRVRLAGHPVERWLDHPSPGKRRYRLFEDLLGDMGIYFNAYWLKVPSGADLGLVRLPPEEVEVVGGLVPSQFRWTRSGTTYDFMPAQVVFYNGYNPLNPLFGLSPLETLRRILAEEAAAGAHREQYWQQASRVEGVIERPINAPKWTPAQKQAWREQWQERFVGAAGAGRIPVLDDGMTFKSVSYSAKESEYLAARKLSREECAAAYHIPLPLVGILEHATFSNIKEQHRHLYQDCLGPWLRMLKEEIEGQLLIEATDTKDVYVEFNIRQKMAGSFEEQATSLHAAVGRPYMTPNEARARLNLPRIANDPTADQLAPQQGGPSAPPIQTAAGATDAETEARVQEVLAITRARQRVRLHRLAVEDRAAAFATDLDRWNTELTVDLLPILGVSMATVERARQANVAMLRDFEDAANREPV